MGTVQEIEAAIEKLSPQERRELTAWYEEHLLVEESPEMLAALDEGIRSLEEKACANTPAVNSNKKCGNGLARRTNRAG